MASSSSSAPGGTAGGHHANPMDQYLQALPTSTSEAPPNTASVRAIINGALTNPRIHSGFAELRSHPAVTAALDRSGTPAGDDPALRTLELFAYGTYRDYADSPAAYLSLTDGQLTKLRQLTVVTLAQRSAASGAVIALKKDKKKGGGKSRRGRGGAGGTAVPYDLLRSELGLADAPLRDVEDLLISCLYAGLVCGRLDQRSMSLLVEASASSAHGSGGQQQPPVAARDVRLEDDVPRMIDELEAFRGRTADVLRSLDGAAVAARDGRVRDAGAVGTMEGAVGQARERARAKLGAGGPEGVPLGGPEGAAWAAAAAAQAAGGLDGGPAAMDLSLEGGVGGGARSAGTVRRQTKRSRGGHGGGEAFARF